MAETDKKRELIIEGAIKRFIHFGIQKTTMNEIAEDLSVSKPSLYYYFPDKSSLILGVVEKIFNDYFDVLSKDQTHQANIESILLNIIEIRYKFFLKYYMLHLSGNTPDPSFNSAELKTYIMKMKEKEGKYFQQIFETALSNKEITTEENLEKTADLYISCLSGLTSLCVTHGNKELFPDKKELKTMKEKQISLTKIFIKGLKN
ncbi:TetR/AcrR family transcriptional regulator [Pedobacter sp. AW31-3R]|uniref:TetR/AcrR family transcriptional regulator n=1 Tax=Pedobacter sp. AW31-3R TaxID=3445781 RepID=UPI003FA0C5E2